MFRAKVSMRGRRGEERRGGKTKEGDEGKGRMNNNER